MIMLKLTPTSDVDTLNQRKESKVMDEMIKIECQACKGDGKDHTVVGDSVYLFRPCAKCKGTGTATVISNMLKVKCPTCNGGGEIYDDGHEKYYRCPRCKGEMTVEVSREKYQELNRRVVCAANKLASGLIVCGARHHDSIMNAQIKACDQTHVGEVQGFIDQFGQFMTREEALVVASRQSQIRRNSEYETDMLYSENLY